MATVESETGIEELLERIEVAIDENEVRQMECDEAMFATLQSEFNVFMAERREKLEQIVATLHDLHPDFMERFWGYRTH